LEPISSEEFDHEEDEEEKKDEEKDEGGIREVVILNLYDL
jgi:hypothetical protein